MKIHWTDNAKADLKDIVRYIARDSKFFAQQTAKEFRARCEQLEAFPESGQMVPEYQDPAIREVFVRSYRMLHRVTPKAVFILTLLHGSRPLPPAPPMDG